MPKLIYHDSDGVDKVLMLGSEPVLVGRATECQVQTQDAMVSRRHARIYWDGNYWVEDLGSSNGVYVGNDKVQKAPFRPGDTVTCGSLVLRLMPDTSPRATGNIPPMTTGAQPAMRAPAPPVGSPPVAPPPMASPPVAPPPMRASSATPAAGSGIYAPPPPAPPPPTLQPPPMAAPAASLASTMPPPARGDVQIGPNAVLRGAAAAPHATTGAQSTLADELRIERNKRLDAEAAVADAQKKLSLAERKLDQAQADLKRMRGGQPPAEETRDDGELQLLRGRVAELEADLRRARVSAPPPAQMGASARGPVADPAAADAAIALGDSLAELRASLRAANDEAGLLTAPAESVQVVGEALRSAAEQLEAARTHLRALGKLLGVS
jgi:FHA domain-containing protein